MSGKRTQMFFIFLFKFAWATLLSTFAFAAACLPGIAVVLGSTKVKTPTAVLVVVGGVPFAFCCGAWAAYCAAFAHEHASAYRLGWNWLYFVTAFMFCTLPLKLGFRESIRRATQDERWKLGLVALCSIWATRVAYVVFGIWPQTLKPAYGWVNGLLF